MKFRYVFMLLGSILTVLALVLTDPSLGVIQNLPIGGGTVSIILVLTTSTLYVAMLYLARRAILDWVNLRDLFEVAKRTPEGAGMALISIGIMMVSLALVILAATSGY